MKFLPLIWSAFRRKTARSILTLLSITVAFLLLGTVTGISATSAGSWTTFQRTGSW